MFTYERMCFNSLEEIRQHKWIGNHASDMAAFDAVDRFAADVKNSLEDRAEALWIAGREGMGLDPVANLEHLTPVALLEYFKQERDL